AADASGLCSKCELYGAFVQNQLGLLALRDVNVCTDEAWRRSIVVIGYEVAGIDPSNLAVWANKTILAMVFASPLGHGLVEARLDARQVVCVHSGSPFGATRLLSPLWQAVDGRIARRNLILFRANVVGVGSDQRELTSEGKL